MTQPVLNAGDLADFEPLVSRALRSDPAVFIRLRASEGLVAGFVRLPYDVLAGRTLRRGPEAGPDYDITFSAADFTAWLAGALASRESATNPEPGQPPRRDAHWLTPLPPRTGWTRINTVPDTTVRHLVRAGADVAQGIGLRKQQQALLSSTVLSVTSDETGAAAATDVPLRAFAALTSMGFLPRDSDAAIDSAPGWLRVAAPYGSTFVSTGAALFSLTAL